MKSRKLPSALASAIVASLLLTAANANADAHVENSAQIITEIERLVNEYAVSRDDHDAVAYSNLFTKDGKLILYGNEYVGRDVLRERVEAGNPNGVSMHFMSSGRIRIVDSQNASGVHYLTLYTGTKDDSHKEGDLLDVEHFRVMGKYHDKYELTDEGWKIAERRLEAIFRDAAAE